MGKGSSISVEEARRLLSRVIPAVTAGDLTAIEDFTEDVLGDGPHLCVRSRADLEHEIMDLTGVLSNIEFTMDGVEEIAGGVIATWRLSADHTGEVLLDEDELIEASGRRIELSAMSLVQFRGGLVSSFQNVYDSRPLFDQLREAPSPDPPVTER